MADTNTAVDIIGDEKAPFILTTESSKADSSMYAGYSERPYNPDEVVKKSSSFAVYDEMRRDDQVKAVLWLKKFMVLSYGWHIETDDAGMEAIAKEIEAELKGVDSPDFTTALVSMLSHLDYGFSITEPVFVVEGGRIKLKSLKTRAPHTFVLHTDEYANLTKIEQYTSHGTITVDPKGIILLQHQYEFGVPYGVSDLQAAHRAWFSKKMVIKFWNIYLERFGNPLVTATIPPTTSAADKDKLLDVLKNLQAKTGIIVPEGVVLNLLSASAMTSAGFESAVNLYNMMISRSMLLPDLIGLGGSETAGGSYSLGKKQFEIFFLTIEKLRQELVKVMNQYIILPLLWWNHGLDASNGVRWSLRPIDREDKHELLRLWSEAVRGNVWKATEEEVNHFRRTVQFPEGPVTIPSSPPPFTPFKKKEENKTYSAREKTSYEKRVDFEKIRGDLDDVARVGANTLIPPLIRIREALLESVRKQRILEGQKSEKIPDLKLKYLKDLQIAWRVVLKTTFDRGWDSAEKEFASYSPKKMGKSILSPSALFEEMISDRSFFITGVMRDAIRKDAGQIIFNGIDKGLSVQEVTHQLSDYFAENYTPVVVRDEEVAIEDVPGRMETIVRTNTLKAYNQGRRNFFEDESVREFIQGYQFSAILDDRTTPICEKLDGETYRLDDPYVDKITPPLHFNNLLPGTMIHTFKGQIPIEEIKKGMLVKTHTGRFLPVTDTMSHNNCVSYLEVNCGGRILRLTDDHPVMTKKGWTYAGDLVEGDEVMSIYHQCKRCGKSFKPTQNPHRVKYCSVSCYYETPRPKKIYHCEKCGSQNKTGKRYCSIFCKSELQKKRHPCQHCGKETQIRRLYCSKDCKHKGQRRNPIKLCLSCGILMVSTWKHPYAKERRFCSRKCYLGFMGESSIEKTVRLYLEESKVLHLPQEKIGRYNVDFFLPDYLTVIEVDGEYWHGDFEKRSPHRIKVAKNRENLILSKGYTLLRLPESAVKSGSFKRFIRRIIDVKDISFAERMVDHQQNYKEPTSRPHV